MQKEEKVKESFVMYGSFLDAAEKAMTLEQIGQYVLLLKNYALKGEDVHSDNPLIEAFLIMAKPNIRAASERYKQSCKGGESGNKGAKYGNLGGRPRKDETKEEYYTRKQLEYERKQRENGENETGENSKSPVETPENPNKPPKNPLNVNDNVYVNKKEKEDVYAYDYVKGDDKEKEIENGNENKKEDDFMKSLMVDDFDEIDNDNYYEDGSASAYMQQQSLLEQERIYNERQRLEEENIRYTIL